ncbi:Phage DNA packaging protein Nu1 [Yersinia kristensenii]|nr:Phage DNA packaging protein Nu1 [Yersinia kristensenii]
MISLSQLARNYGYDESTMRKWKQQGMPHGKNIPDEITIQWIVENQIKPLRNTDVKEQIEIQRLLKLTAEARQAEIDLEIKMESLIETQYLENELATFFKRIRDHIRTIPNKTYLELFEQEQAVDVKRTLQQAIDNCLNEIGGFNIGGKDAETEQEQITESTTKVNKENITTSKTKTI